MRNALTGLAQRALSTGRGRWRREHAPGKGTCLVGGGRASGETETLNQERERPGKHRWSGRGRWRGERSKNGPLRSETVQERKRKREAGAEKRECEMGKIKTEKGAGATGETDWRQKRVERRGRWRKCPEMEGLQR